MSKWIEAFDERQQAQIRFARLYVEQFRHGADGHNNMLIVAKMAELLDQAGGAAVSESQDGLRVGRDGWPQGGETK